MKNKKAMYVLLPVALLVWGLVLYKVMQSLEAPETGYRAGPVPGLPGREAYSEPDTFRLLLGYRDPFLAARAARGKAADPFAGRPVAAGSSSQVEAGPARANALVWPPVEYLGLIENKAQKNQVAILRIGEAEHLLLEGQTAEGVWLRKLLQDSVLVDYNLEKKYVPRN